MGAIERTFRRSDVGQMARFQAFLKPAGREKGQTGDMALMTSDTLRFLANQPLPFEAKTIAVDGGRMSRRPLHALAFRCTFGSLPVHVAVRCEAGSANMRVTARIGGTPYSAEGKRRRAVAAALMAASDKRDPPPLVVDRERQMWIDETVTLTEPLSPSWMIAELIAVMLRIKPWLDIAELLSVAAARSGSADETPATSAVA